MSGIAVIGRGRVSPADGGKDRNVEGTLRNVKQLNAPCALTEPIARVDLATVRVQVEALRPFPAAARVHKVLGGEAVSLAERTGLEGRKVKALRRLPAGR